METDSRAPGFWVRDGIRGGHDVEPVGATHTRPGVAACTGVDAGIIRSVPRSNRIEENNVRFLVVVFNYFSGRRRYAQIS